MKIVEHGILHKPIVRQLEEKYGGKWSYYPFRGWGCEKPKMIAHYVYEGGYDMDGNPMEENNLLLSSSSMKALRVYGNGKNGERFYPERD